MSVQADIYLSRDDEEAIRYNGEPATFKDREQCTSFTVLGLSTLWAEIRAVEWDVNSLDEFHTVIVQDGERTIKRLPEIHDWRTGAVDTRADFGCCHQVGSHRRDGL